uniref:C-type lectin domain-containing protein n=1 Tax=Mucochytrium quahogii TaxID=96639 RepID=A0A7S2SBB2_9STRA|mmetsp:Transcript_3465/g.7453  ORF Transcript_3465/g.7453 Transcript_3465/m.7453 type:complete len:526 (+) Transcript_3465:567-2144(+)
MKILLQAWLALWAVVLVSQTLGQSIQPDCKRAIDDAREEFPTRTIKSYDYSAHIQGILDFNLALSSALFSLIYPVALVARFMASVTAVANVGIVTAIFFGKVFQKDPSIEYDKLLGQVANILETDHLQSHLEGCIGAFNAFHVFMDVTYDCSSQDYKVRLLQERINSLLTKCDVDGSWGAQVTSEPNLRDSLRTSLESGNVSTPGSENSCTDLTGGLCYELMPIVSAAAVTSLNLVESVYQTTKNGSTQDILGLTRLRLVSFVNHLHHPETVRLWASKMNKRTEVVCQSEWRCQEYTTTTHPRSCIEYASVISRGSYYSWNWGTEKGWLDDISIKVDPLKKQDPCKLEDHRKSSERFNLAKVEHLTRPSFPHPNTLSSTLNQDCAGLLWGEICLLESDNTWTRSTCEHIRHNYFCEYTPGCKMDDGKCVSIQPESIENCWLQGLPAGSNNMAGCSLLSSKTTTGCSWRAGWGCRPGLDEGAVVGTQSCAKDYKPCLKDWGSNGTEWSVCANSTECVNVYHGKVIV